VLVNVLYFDVLKTWTLTYINDITRCRKFDIIRHIIYRNDIVISIYQSNTTGADVGELAYWGFLVVTRLPPGAS